MSCHILKIQKQYYDAIFDGRKRFEVRLNDRNYQVGDYLSLREIDKKGKYTGNGLLVQVTYILDDDNYCKPDFVVMSIKLLGGA